MSDTISDDGTPDDPLLTQMRTLQQKYGIARPAQDQNTASTVDPLLTHMQTIQTKYGIKPAQPSSSVDDRMIPSPSTPYTEMPFHPTMRNRLLAVPGNVAGAIEQGLWNLPTDVVGGVAQGYQNPSLLTPMAQNYLDKNHYFVGQGVRGLSGIIGGIGGTANALVNTVGGVANAALPPNAGGDPGNAFTQLAATEMLRRAAEPAPMTSVGMQYRMSREASPSLPPPMPSTAPSFIPPGSNVPVSTLERAKQLINADNQMAANKPSMIPPTTSTDLAGNVTPINQPANPLPRGAATVPPAVTTTPLLDGMKLDEKSTPNADPASPQTRSFVDRMSAFLWHHAATGITGTVVTSLGDLPTGLGAALLMEIAQHYGPNVSRAVWRASQKGAQAGAQVAPVILNAPDANRQN